MARHLTEKLAVSFLGILSTLALAGTAQAGCHSGTYCNASKASHPAYNPPALSTWSQHNGAATWAQHSGQTISSSHNNTWQNTAPRSVTYASPAPVSYASSSSVTYAAPEPTRYLTSARTAPAAACPAGSTRQADGICLSTASSYSTTGISSSYSVTPLTRSVLTGLGTNESLQPTNCPVAVHNPNGARVLGCYNVVKPKPVVRTVVRTVPTVYQVVRPVIYVRTPVPVCNTCCTPEKIVSRYGGIAQPTSSCGW